MVFLLCEAFFPSQRWKTVFCVFVLSDIVNSAKIGPAHGKKMEWTDMVDSWVKYGKPMAARANFSDLDYDAAVEFLSRELMEKMGYKYPPSK